MADIDGGMWAFVGMWVAALVAGLAVFLPDMQRYCERAGRAYSLRLAEDALCQALEVGGALWRGFDDAAFKDVAMKDQGDDYVKGYTLGCRYRNATDRHDRARHLAQIMDDDSPLWRHHG